MATVRDPTQTSSQGVAFEVERVEWTSADQVEVVGRWFGVRGRRFIRPTLDVEVDGEARRMLAVLDHKPWAALDGESWVAAFAWVGEPADLVGSELTVAPDLTVELHPPGTKRPGRRRYSRPSRADVLARELASVREEVERLARELEGTRAVHAAELERKAASHAAELERARDELAAARQETERRAAELGAERRRAEQLEAELRDARDEVAAAQAESAARGDELDRERAALEAEIRKTTAEDVERLRAERNAAIDDAVGAHAARDAARRESVSARAERDAAIRDRDRVHQERNVLLARARSDAMRRRAQSPPPAASSEAPSPATPEKSASPAGRETDPRPPAPRGPASRSAAAEMRRPTVSLPSERPGAVGDSPAVWRTRRWWQPYGSRAPMAARVTAIAALMLLAAVLVLLISGAF